MDDGAATVKLVSSVALQPKYGAGRYHRFGGAPHSTTGQVAYDAAKIVGH